MKKFLTIFMALIIAISLATPVFAADSACPSLESEAGILMDARTGQVLYQKNMDEQLYPASITKIMTILLGLENGNLNDTITMSHQAVYSIERGDAHIALDVGEQITLEQALMAAMLPSANDAANGIAEQISGSIPEFVKLMNERAIQAGALHTNFANANGLPNDEHVTTAYDMAMITKEALKYEQFRRIFGTLQYEIPPTNLKSQPRDFWTEHKMLKPGKYKYNGVIGGKTGYTKEAQCTLVTAARRGDRELIVVVLKSSTSGVYNDTKTLLDYGFDQFNPTTIMLPAVTTANLISPQDNLKSAQDIINKVKDIPYTWLLNKNVDASDIAIDYSAVQNPTAQNPGLSVDIHLKNQSDLMYSNLGSITMESLPNSNHATNASLSKIMKITWTIIKITAAVIMLLIVLLITLRLFIRRKNKKRRRYGVLDTSIKKGKSIDYNRSRV